MSRATLAVDVVIAAAITAFVLIIAPGVAVTGMVAVVIVIVCAIGSALGRRGRARQRR